MQSALSARTNMLSSLRGDLRNLIQERQARIDAAARARAAALAQQQADAGVTGGAGGGSVPTVDTSPPPPAGSVGQQAVAIAQRYLGVPYVWGGASPSGFDCSGLTMYVYAQLGVSLPHYTGSQWGSGAHVSMGQLAPGDLVFFYPASATWASTWAAASSSTPPTPATWSKSPAFPATTRPTSSAASESPSRLVSSSARGLRGTLGLPPEHPQTGDRRMPVAPVGLSCPVQPERKWGLCERHCIPPSQVEA